MGGFSSGDNLPEATSARVLVYGQAGVGKSTVAATAPGPRFILAADTQWAQPLRRSFSDVPRLYNPDGETDRKPAAYYHVESWSEVQQAVGMLTGSHRGKYKTVIVDTVSTVFHLARRDLQGKKLGEMTDVKSLSEASWGTLLERMLSLREALHTLPAHVVWLSLARLERDGQANIDLDGNIKHRLAAACDAVLFMEAARNAAGERILRLRTQTDDVSNSKCNSGLLNVPYEHADLAVVLAKMGFAPPIPAEVMASFPDLGKDTRGTAPTGTETGTNSSPVSGLFK